VVLPIGTFAESSGTFVNAEGRWQSWAGAASLVGESRPGWKVLRVLANLLNIQGVDYVSSEDVRDALRTLCGARLVAPTGPSSAAAGRGDADLATQAPAAAGRPSAPGPGGTGAAKAPGAWVDIPPYQVDVLVRGSESLAKTKDGHAARAVL
jgi:NADH-quinone oxidoreductase subunit G